MTNAIKSDVSVIQKPGEEVNTNFLKGMIRQHWTARLENSVDLPNNKQIINDMEIHVANMNQIVDQLEYELFCIQNIISHSKSMTREELQQYLKIMESLAVGYSSMIGKDITGLLMIGITAKAKNLSSAEKYYSNMANDIDSKIKRYHKILEHHKKHVDRISFKAKTHQSSVLRFFKKRKIARLYKRMDSGMRKIERISNRLDKVYDIHRSVRLKANKD